MPCLCLQGGSRLNSGRHKRNRRKRSNLRRRPGSDRTSSSSSATTSARPNISAYTHGVVGYKTPNIDRIAKEGMMFTDYYAENSCTAGRSTFITGQARLRTGLSQGRHSRRDGRPAGTRHHHRPGAQAARLRHRPVRQEPSRRPRRIPADQARLRRVLRQPLPPQRRGGAGAALLAEERSDFRQGQLARAACSRRPPTARSRTPGR